MFSSAGFWYMDCDEDLSRSSMLSDGFAPSRVFVRFALSRVCALFNARLCLSFAELSWYVDSGPSASLLRRLRTSSKAGLLCY
jgi:hypothetical protein